MKKKKRFYKNVKRNQKWTEEVQGRQIDFADKYIYTGDYSDKYDYLRPKRKRKRLTKEALSKHLKRLGAVAVAIAIISVGYTAMDVYMIRTGIPSIDEAQTDDSSSLKDITLDLQSKYIDAVSLDGNVMLDAVIDEALKGGFNCISFDIKRSNGSIGYKSSLAAVDTYGAIAFPAPSLKASCDKLKKGDILTVGIVSCYLDNLVADKNRELALYSRAGSVYRDSRDNTYLNPDAQGTYSYIRDIISEAYDMGVTVFVLTGCDLPSEISDEYNDGFDTLAARLYEDIGSGIKLLQADKVHISKDALEDRGEGADEYIIGKFTNEEQRDMVYIVTSSADKEELKEKLEECGISNYILQ